MDSPEEELTEETVEGFGELLRYTAAGYVGGLAVGAALDWHGLARSGVGQWLVRTLAGEGESALEGVFALRRRVARSARSMAEAYGWGKFAGMAVPWVVDAASRAAGVDVYGAEGFYIPFFYALSDQMGALAAGFLFLRRSAPTAGGTLRAWVAHPVMRSGLLVVMLVPAGLLLGRLMGFSPTTQVRTALETIAANLCWVPPLVGWLAERRRRGVPRAS